jgi:hypothetical protein
MAGRTTIARGCGRGTAIVIRPSGFVVVKKIREGGQLTFELRAVARFGGRRASEQRAGVLVRTLPVHRLPLRRSRVPHACRCEPPRRDAWRPREVSVCFARNNTAGLNLESDLLGANCDSGGGLSLGS